MAGRVDGAQQALPLPPAPSAPKADVSALDDVHSAIGALQMLQSGHNSVVNSPAFAPVNTNSPMLAAGATATGLNVSACVFDFQCLFDPPFPPTSSYPPALADPIYNPLHSPQHTLTPITSAPLPPASLIS